MLGRKVIWMICALHTNELLLRHLMTVLDGKTISDDKFAGPIGKLIAQATEFEIKACMPTIDVDIDLVILEVDIIKELSAH